MEAHSLLVRMMATKVVIKKVRITIHNTAHKMKIQLTPSQGFPHVLTLLARVLVAIYIVGHESWVNLTQQRQQYMEVRDHIIHFDNLLPGSTYQSYFLVAVGSVVSLQGSKESLLLLDDLGWVVLFRVTVIVTFIYSMSK